MRKIQKQSLGKRIAIVATLGLASLVGCEKDSISEPEPKNEDYFATIPMEYGTGMAMISGDFDNDGDEDFIVGAKDPDTSRMARAYFYENDGKGNFYLRVQVEGEQ